MLRECSDAASQSVGVLLGRLAGTIRECFEALEPRRKTFPVRWKFGVPRPWNASPLMRAFGESTRLSSAPIHCIANSV